MMNYNIALLLILIAVYSHLQFILTCSLYFLLLIFLLAAYPYLLLILTCYCVG